VFSDIRQFFTKSQASHTRSLVGKREGLEEISTFLPAGKKNALIGTDRIMEAGRSGER